MDSIRNLRGLNSLSCPSEPPDIGNWFSSYGYRSPEPDSNFTLEDSAFVVPDSQRDGEQEVDFQKIRAGEEGAVNDDNHNEDKCFKKNMDSSSSCSLFSEPPDIRNWFSSYVYESFAPDTISPSMNEEVSEENKHGNERLDFEVMNRDEDMSENFHQNVCAEHNSFDRNSKGDGSAEIKEDLTIASTFRLEKILQPCMQDKALQHNIGPIEYVETFGPNNGTPGSNREADVMSFDSDTCARAPPKKVQKHDTKEMKSKAQFQADKLDNSAALDKNFSSRSSTCTRNKENDGFVTMRKNSCTIENCENSCKKPEKTLLQCPSNTGIVPLAREKNGVTKRKALAEATNLQQSNAMEITGKWQCPQKRKPNVGPALKQRRLDQYMRKIISPD